MKPDYISGNVYHFGTIDRGEHLMIEIDKPIKRAKNGNETPVIICNDEDDCLFILNKGDSIEFPCISGYPDRFYICGDYTDQGTVISLAIEEFGDRINTNYWDKRVIAYEDE